MTDNLTRARAGRRPRRGAGDRRLRDRATVAARAPGRSCMVFDADGAQVAYMAHWQEAREASAGGFGVQSGGCGCK